MDNTEETVETPTGSVETKRGVSKKANYSNLAEDYKRLGDQRKVAALYGVSKTAIRYNLRKQGIPINPTGQPRGREKSAHWMAKMRKHWDDPEWREQRRQTWIKTMPALTIERFSSQIERNLHHVIVTEGLSFSTQELLLGRYLADILLTQKPVVIEADGIQHSYAKQKEKDRLRDAALRDAGYMVYRFTAKQIARDPLWCVRKVISECDLVPDYEPVALIRNGISGENSPEWNGPDVTFACHLCGAEYQTRPTRRKLASDRHFCTLACRNAWRGSPEFKELARKWAMERYHGSS